MAREAVGEFYMSARLSEGATSIISHNPNHIARMASGNFDSGRRLSQNNARDGTINTKNTGGTGHTASFNKQSGRDEGGGFDIIIEQADEDGQPQNSKPSAYFRNDVKRTKSAM